MRRLLMNGRRTKNVFIFAPRRIDQIPTESEPATATANRQASPGSLVPRPECGRVAGIQNAIVLPTDAPVADQRDPGSR